MPIGMEIHSCDVLDAIHWQTRNGNSKYGESMKVILSFQTTVKKLFIFCSAKTFHYEI